MLTFAIYHSTQAIQLHNWLRCAWNDLKMLLILKICDHHPKYWHNCWRLLGTVNWLSESYYKWEQVWKSLWIIKDSSSEDHDVCSHFLYKLYSVTVAMFSLGQSGGPANHTAGPLACLKKERKYETMTFSSAERGYETRLSVISTTSNIITSQGKWSLSCWQFSSILVTIIKHLSISSFLWNSI